MDTVRHSFTLLGAALVYVLLMFGVNSVAAYAGDGQMFPVTGNTTGTSVVDQRVGGGVLPSPPPAVALNKLPLNLCDTSICVPRLDDGIDPKVLEYLKDLSDLIDHSSYQASYRLDLVPLFTAEPHGILICNRGGGATARAAYAFNSEGIFRAVGWTEIPAGRCSTPLATNILSGNIYYYAQDSGGLRWAGNTPICVDTTHNFDRHQPGGCDQGLHLENFARSTTSVVELTPLK